MSLAGSRPNCVFKLGDRGLGYYSEAWRRQDGSSVWEIFGSREATYQSINKISRQQPQLSLTEMMVMMMMTVMMMMMMRMVIVVVQVQSVVISISVMSLMSGRNKVV